MEELMKGIQDKLDRMDKRSERIETKIDTFQKELQNVKQENIRLKEENKELCTKITEQENRIEILERESRKKKIIVKGIQETEEESELILKEKIRKMLQKIEIPINMETETWEVRRIGRIFQDRKTPRPIIIEFASWNKKMEVLKAAKKLKGSDIWISEDYTKQVQQQRKILIGHMKEARSKGYRANISYNKLIINGEYYNTEQVHHYADHEEEQQDQGEGDMKKKGRTMSQRSPTVQSEEDPERLKKSTHDVQKEGGSKN